LSVGYRDAFLPSTDVLDHASAKALVDKYKDLEVEMLRPKVALYQKMKDGGFYFSDCMYQQHRCLGFSLFCGFI
jgi:hypothetical protein